MGGGDPEMDADRIDLHVGGMRVALPSLRAEASTRVDQEKVLADGVELIGLELIGPVATEQRHAKAVALACSTRSIGAEPNARRLPPR